MNDVTEDNTEESLSKAERKALRRQEKKQQQIESEQARQRNSLIKKSLIIGAAILVLSGVSYAFINSDEKVILDITKECITHQNLALHIHPHLRIIVNGEDRDIPANIGIPSANCMRPIHTHDTTGVLHVEYTRPREFMLGEFFQIWEQPFSSEQILDYIVDGNHEIIVTVNGQVNEDYENLILRDENRIVIKYQEKQ